MCVHTPQKMFIFLAFGIKPKQKVSATCRSMAVAEAGQHQGGEWKVSVPAAAGAAVATETGRRRVVWLLSAWPAAVRASLVSLGKATWKTGADDPRKVVHGLKMAVALNVCSALYYVRPLYVFTGENAMWAILTVVLILEYTVGK